MPAANHAPYAVRQVDDFEPQYGLPERLPDDETLLWQGSPDWRLAFRHVFHGRAVALYFCAMLAWQVGARIGDGSSVAEALGAAGRVLPLYLFALGLLALLAWALARTTAYTLTSKRVVMRIGIVLTVTYNLPLRCIDAASTHALARNHGDVALQLKPGIRIAWLHLWPHARPWHVKQPQPMLRCVPDAAAVGQRLLHAWSEANEQAAASVAGAANEPGPVSPVAAHAARPAMAAVTGPLA